MSTTTSKQVINLVRGWPSTSLLPTAAISHAAQTVLGDTTVAYPALLYGPDEGHMPLREAIASWNASFYQPEHGITSERVSITGGASQNIGCMLQVFTDPIYTRNVWIVAPAYMLAFRIFQDNGFAGKMRAIREDSQGLDVESLRREMQKSEDAALAEGNVEPKSKRPRSWAKIYRHVIYCVPTFANPSSRTMSLDRREALVRCAREFDALIIADDVYDRLQWPADGSETALTKAYLPRLVDIDSTLDGGTERAEADGFGNAMSNGSFSKLIAPGLRLGWAEGTPKFAYGVSQVGTTRSGGNPSQLTSVYVNQMLQSGFVRDHLFQTVQPAYARRYRVMLQAVKDSLLPLGCSLAQSDRSIVGGYFIWVALPDHVDADSLAERCQTEENVVVAPGSMFEVPGDENVAFPNSIRLCFSWEDETLLVEGVKRTAEALGRMLKDGGKPKSQQGNSDGGNFW